jgi:archaellum component FlaC
MFATKDRTTINFAVEISPAEDEEPRTVRYSTNCTMNKITLTTLLITLLSACTQDPKTTEPYRQLEEDQQRTAAVIAEKDSTINALFGTFNRISENLRTIRSKQGELVAPGTGTENKDDMEQRIMGDIEQIDGLLSENKGLIAQLRKQAKTSKSSIAELERTIADLERSSAEKSEEIGMLKEQLASTNSSLATLIEMYRDKSQLADMQRGELNAAYYAIGTAKELKEKGVLTKEGGVAGIGGVNKLNTANLPTDYFTSVDITGTQEIVIGAKKAKLTTSHPEGSYRFENGAAKLVITDPTKFWSISKYLVVVVE